LKVPVFGSELTIELAKINVKNYAESKKFNNFHIVDENTEIDFGNAVISFFSTTHTIPESLGIVLSTNSGNVVYTGDFRFDPAVAPGYRTNMRRLAEIGANGVLALLSSSPNAMSPLQSATEHEIYEKIYDYINDSEGRVIIACNAGNLGRIQQVIDAAFKIGRRIVFSSEDMDQIIETATRLKKLRIIDKKSVIKPEDVKKYADNELVILETGRMGEPLKALGDMAHRRHKYVKIQEGDLVLAVTSPTVSFETMIARIENDIYKAGGVMKMLASDLTISGHANARDLQFLIDILRPKNLIPIQGEYRQLRAHAELGMDMGILPEHIFIAKRGESVEFRENEMVPAGVVPAENVMIDGAGVGDIGSVVLRDRKVLSEDGIFIAVVTISKTERKIVAKSRVHTRGFVYVKTSRDLMREAGELVNETVEKYLAGKDFDWAEIKGSIRDALGKFLYDQTRRKPVVLPVVMEARQPQELTKRYGKKRNNNTSNNNNNNKAK
jgi:ribonuclease J